MKEHVKKTESQKLLLLLHTFTLDQGKGGSNANKQSNFLAPLRKLSHVNASKLVKKLHHCAHLFCIGLGNLNTSLRRAILHRLRRRQAQRRSPF